MPYKIGDVVTIKEPANQLYDNTRGVIRAILNEMQTLIRVETAQPNGVLVWFDLIPAQIELVKIDPTFLKFKTFALPELTNNAVASYNAEQDQLFAQVNADIEALKTIARQSEREQGYTDGFNKGYTQGYDDAIFSVRELMVKTGLIDPNKDKGEGEAA